MYNMASTLFLVCLSKFVFKIILRHFVGFLGAPLAILKIVGICLGTATACVLIGIVGYKYIKSRRNDSRRDADCVPLQEQAIEA